MDSLMNLVVTHTRNRISPQGEQQIESVSLLGDYIADLVFCHLTSSLYRVNLPVKDSLLYSLGLGLWNCLLCSDSI